MDGTDLDDWPSITASPKLSSEGAGGGMQEQDCPGNNNNSSASWGERNVQQKGGTAAAGGGEGEGNMDNLYPPRFSPLSPSSSPNECAQPSGVWVSSTSPQVEVGQGSAASYNSKVSQLLPGPQESPLGGGGGGSSSSVVPGANFNPNVNPSAWPALGQSGTSASACSGSSQNSSTTSASSFSASTTVVTTQTLSSVNQTGLYQQQHTETAAGAETGDQQQQHLGNPGPEPCSAGAAKEAGPNREGVSGEDSAEAGEAVGNASGSSSSSSAASSSWSAMPPVASDLASQSDGWGRASAGAQGQEGVVWRFGSQSDKVGWGRESGGGSTNPVVSQGAWEGGSTEASWGGTAEGARCINLAIGSGGEADGSSSSTDSVGGGGCLEDSASQNLATMTKAWDNQKGTDRKSVV